MKKLLGCAMATGAVLLVIVALVSAQERRPLQDQIKQKTDQIKQKTDQIKQKTETREPATQIDRDQGRRNNADVQLVTWLLSSSEGEIALAKFAAERAQNEDVKKFAQQMVEEHSELVTKLRRTAPLAAATATDPAATKRRDDVRTNEPTRPQSKTDTAKTGEATIQRGYFDPEGRIDLLRMKQEIDKQNLETFKHELGEKSGAEFDNCFMGLQIMAHLGMSDTIKVAKNYASPELRHFLDDGEKTTKEHLEHAKDIMKQLGGLGAKR